MPSVVALSNGAPGHEVLLEGAVLLRMFREPRAEVAATPALASAVWICAVAKRRLGVCGEGGEALLNAGPDGGSWVCDAVVPSRWSLPSGVRPVGRLRSYEGGESVRWRGVELKVRLLSGRCLTEGPPHESRIGNLLQPRIHDERREEA